MAVSTRNNIVTNGLVLYLDAANTKSLPAPPSTNLMVWSQDFTQTNWAKVRSSVTASATTAPNSTLTGTRLVNDTSTNSHYIRSDGYSFTAGETYTISFYAKAAEQTWISLQINEANVVFPTTYTDLTNGVLGNVGAGTTATVQSVGNGWYRTSITRTVANTGLSYFGIFTATSNGLNFYAGDGTSGVYVWGVQLEKLPYVTPYIPTTTTSVSRNTWRDVSGNGNSGSLVGGPIYNSSNGGIIVFDGVDDYTSIGTGTNYPLTTLTYETWVKTPSTGSNMSAGAGLISLGNGNTMFISPAGSLRFIITSGSSLTRIVQAIYNGKNLYDNQWHHIVCCKGSSTYEMYIDSVLVTAGSNGAAPGWDGLSGYSSGLALIASNPNDVTYKLSGSIALTRIYNKALTQAEILQNYNATKTRFNLT